MSLFWNTAPTAPFWRAEDSLFWLPSGAAYQYDQLGRLTEISFPDGTTVVFNYGSMGNRTSVVTTAV